MGVRNSHRHARPFAQQGLAPVSDDDPRGAVRDPIVPRPRPAVPGPDQRAPWNNPRDHRRARCDPQPSRAGSTTTRPTARRSSPHHPGCPDAREAATSREPGGPAQVGGQPPPEPGRKLADCSSSDPTQSLFRSMSKATPPAAPLSRGAQTRRNQVIPGCAVKSQTPSKPRRASSLSNKEQDRVGAWLHWARQLRRKSATVGSFLPWTPTATGIISRRAALTFFYRYSAAAHRKRLKSFSRRFYRIDVGKETHLIVRTIRKEELLGCCPKTRGRRSSASCWSGEMMPAAGRRPRPWRRVALQDHGAEPRGRLRSTARLAKIPSARFRFIMERAADAQTIDVRASGRRCLLRAAVAAHGCPSRRCFH